MLASELPPAVAVAPAVAGAGARAFETRFWVGRSSLGSVSVLAAELEQRREEEEEEQEEQQEEGEWIWGWLLRGATLPAPCPCLRHQRTQSRSSRRWDSDVHKPRQRCVARTTTSSSRYSSSSVDCKWAFFEFYTFFFSAAYLLFIFRS